MMGNYWTAKVAGGYAWALAIVTINDVYSFKTTLISDQLYATEAEADAAGNQKLNDLMPPP